MPGVLLACLGTGLFNPAAGAVALSALPPERSGLAAGAISLIGAVGTAGLLLGRRAVAPSAVAVPAADAA